MKRQTSAVEQALNEKVYELIGRLSELGFTSDIYSNVKDFKKELAIVPVSAKTGEGIAELLMLVAGLSQRFLEARLNIEVRGPARGSILERKEVRGFGDVIDVILYDGTLRVNDTIAFATPNGVATTKVKAILKPNPLSDIRDAKSRFTSISEVAAASGIRVNATGLEDAMPGSPLIQVVDESYKDEIKTDIGNVFEVDKRGVLLKADSIGSLEAITKLFHSEGLEISRKGLGNVTKNDVSNAFAINTVDPLNAVIVAFNVKIDEDAAEAARDSNVRIISGNIIYKLIDDYKLFLEQRKKASIKSLEEMVTFPGKIEVLPNSCFRASHPAIFGIRVIAGSIKPGCTLIGATGERIGKIKGVQNEKTPLKEAKRGEMVAISIEGPTFGRQVNENQILYTRISESDYKILKKELAELMSDEDAKLLEEIIGLERNDGEV